MEGAFIGYCSQFGQEVCLLQVNLQKASDSRVFWDSVPQTSIYSNSNSAVVEPPGGGCNILPRSQVPILGLYYATISTIATSSGSGTCGAAQNANRWRQQRPLFHFLFRSRGLGKAGNTISFSGARGLGKREIPFPFPVHVAQGTGKYHFRFRCTWNLGGWRKPGYRDSSQGLSLSRDLTGACIFAVFNCTKLSPTLNVWSHVVAMHTLAGIGTYTFACDQYYGAHQEASNGLIREGWIWLEF